jgi:microsomal dipeptidase-like Zn-dependent dipeptidase
MNDKKHVENIGNLKKKMKAIEEKTEKEGRVSALDYGNWLTVQQEIWNELMGINDKGIVEMIKNEVWG